TKKEYLCELYKSIIYHLVTQRKKQILISILLFLFALHYANITFFFHSHNINGFTVSHSHFHDNHHAKAGTHTASELALIDVLSAFQSLQAAICQAGIGLFLLCMAVLRIGSEQKRVSVTPCHSYLRAPPVLLF
ncbi:hypothetical protein LJC38_02720, partial [Parabacteroides sp. OttesenSCG-928-K15]|nr:hypothetical protein [Parabacteroides sp. OttesenSCG-928-K15]